MLSEYKSFNDHVRKQLALLAPKYKNDHRVIAKNKDICKKNNISDTKINDYSIYLTYNTRHFLILHYGLMYCYSMNNDDRIKFDSILCVKSYAVLLNGVYNGKPVVVKYYLSNDRTIKYEINIYNKLKNLGCPLLPWFSDEFMVLNERVLVLERLDPLDKDEDIYAVGKDVIDQLAYLHTFGIHCDIKPDNIMKKVIDGEMRYLLIDYGGVAIKREENGYRRWIWTRKYTSQCNSKNNHVTFPKNDFLELLYTLNYIHNHSTGHDFKIICPACVGCFQKQINKVGNKLYDEIDYNKLRHSLHSHRKD